MSTMESPLDVLSRAATMVQDNANESRLTTKELPTAKWRRDRRLRTSEYHHPTSPPASPQNQQSPSNSAAIPTVKPLTESTNTTSNTIECPIDMSVTSTTIRHRNSPPPPYREPLPGSTFATTLARPSVITQAPPKRDTNHFNTISNRENDNSSSESISMCDPVIDEHFRRSLGADYMALFGKKIPSPPAAISSPPPQLPPSPQSIPTPISPKSPKPVASPKSTITVTQNDSIADSVDDHFAKALGDTWKKLQANKEANNKSDSEEK